MIPLVVEHGRWEHAGQRYFDGEVEPCINGRTIETGAYFGVDVAAIVERILGERLTDGRWNCEAENGSVRSSFDTTINVLDGLVEFERTTGGSSAVGEARRGGEQYLLERSVFRRKSTGEVVDPAYLDVRVPVLLALRRAARPRLLSPRGRRPGSCDGGGRRGRAVQTPARRPVAAGPHPSGSRPLRPRGWHRSTGSVEHPPRPPGARVVGPRGLRDRDVRQRRRLTTETTIPLISVGLWTCSGSPRRERESSNAFSLICSPSWKSMARLVFPSRLELKSPEGSFTAAPLAKVIFTTFL